ncbi:LPD38 domain-containing protein [Halomonas sp. SSL-5]|uniref:LPD38 domain-containing protein n=1 Tax=Halomonas sp. SSL-5 TaxID=3065855 RepID=UPI002738C33E|nr:LPD38 domain-containing protein [Halomonas sp. SSL-5]MDY7116616.1 LPD38 domain-containing protein [Halomonas sp. SSL-5]
MQQRQPEQEPAVQQPQRRPELMAEPWQSGSVGQTPRGLDMQAEEDGAEPAQPQQPDRIRASDFGLETLEGGVSGVGSAAGGTGDFLTFGGNLVESGLRKLGLGDLIDAGDRAMGNMAPSDAFQAFEKWMQRGAEEIDASQTEAFRETMKASTPDGDLFDWSTWSFGDDPSVTGYAAQLAGLVGQFAPQAATMLAGSPQRVATAMTLMGGAQAGGSQANEAEERIMGMQEGELAESSGLYRDLREGGLDHAEAQRQTAKVAGAAAFQGGAPTGAAGGALTSYVLGPLQAKIGGSLAGRLVDSVGLQGGGEALQEVSETMLARANTNRAIEGNQDIGEGTFGDAVLGGMFGAGLGTAGAAGGAARGDGEVRTPNDAVRERTPEDRAALNEQFEQQQREAAARQTVEEAPQPEQPMGLQGVSDADFENAWREFERDNELEPLDDINAPTGLEIPITGETRAKVEEAAAETDTEPTPGQAEAGNYRKGKVRLNGFEIAIENPKGSTRRGTAPDGTEWENRMAHHYGDIKGTTAADGDNLDVFVGDNPEAPRAFIIDQVNEDGSFDEHKILLGFNSLEEARQGYLASYDEGWQGLGEISEVSVDDLKGWVRDGAHDMPFSDMAAPEPAQPEPRGLDMGDTPAAPPVSPDTTRPEAAEEREEPADDLLGDPIPSSSLEADAEPGALTPVRVPVGRIRVDPEAYQFRTEVNERGVDDRMDGIRRWDDLRAGELVLHERADGELYVADGHHRLDLARRLEQPGVNAFVLREADGYSVEDARRLAAERNIASGSSTAIDAAKVFRNTEGDPAQVIEDRDLPRRSQVVRDGADIARLQGEAFGAVLNGVVAEKDGAAIGRSSDDADQQLAAIDVFRQVSPQNDNQRALLINEIRQAGFSDGQSNQMGMFGDDPMQSLIGERVRVMDRLHQVLSRDRRLFATLNSNAKTAEAAGNRIATERNEQLSDTAAQAIQLLSRATTTPEINQQINDAARRVSEGEPVASVVRELKEALLSGPVTETAQQPAAPDPGRGSSEGRGQVERGNRRAPAADAARAEDASEQRLAGAEAEAQGITLKANGTPFQTERAVQLSKRFRDTPGAVAVEVEGGWGFTAQGDGAVTPAPAESPQNDAESLTLETQTEESLAAREREQQQAEQAEADRRRQEEERAQADRDADDFTLAGSDLPADQAAARGQDTLFAFAGQRARTADPMALESAQRRLARGDDPDTVRREVGWFLGADEKWRFEIDDSDARFLPFVDKSAGELWTKPLEEVIDHPRLFAAYPELREMDVVSARGMGNQRGRFVARRREIMLNAERDPMEQFSTLLHEIQHGIQNIEGFASGGDPSSYRLPPRREQWLRDKVQELTRESGDFAREVLDRYKAGDLTSDEAQQRIQERADEIGLNELRQKLREGDARGAYRYYQRLYGETEARNVQARQGMGEEERVSTPPSETQDVPDSDVVVVFNGEEVAGAPPPANADPEVQPEREVPPPRVEDVAEALKGLDELGDATAIQSPRELPPQALLGMAIRGVDPADVRGMYIGGDLYVIADNVDSVEEAVRTAVHEAVGHKGIRGVLGEELEPVMRQLYRRLPHSRIGREARDEVLRDYPFLDRDNPDDQITIAEEMVAHLIEKGHRPAAWQRAVAKIKELLRKLFPSIPWTTTDVLELGEKSRDYLRRRQAEADEGQADDMTFAMRRRMDTSRVSDEFSDLDADQAEALDMIGPLGVTGSALTKARDVMDRAAVKLRAGLFDKYAALKELDEKALGRDFIESSTASSSWILARMAPAAQGALHTLIHNGRIRLDPEQKVLELQEGDSPGLAGVLAQLGDAAEVTRFMGWIAGNRAEKLAEQGRENYFEPRHIAGLMELNSGRTKEGKARRTLYAEVFEEFQQYRDDVLAIADQAGLLKKAMSEPEADLVIARKYGAPEAIINKLRHEGDSLAKAEEGDLLDRAQARYAMAHRELADWLAESVETAQGDALEPASQRLDAIMQELESLQRDQREMWAEEFYVPFYRVLDENTNDVQGPASTAGLTRQRAYQRLKGADMRIGDLLENTLMNYHHLLSASMKNLAAVQAIENAEQVEIAREVPESDRDPKTSTFVLREGQQVFYEISDDLVYKALVNMTDAGMSALMNSSSLKTMRWFKRLLTNMVTVTLEFVGANTIRDSLQSAAVTPAGMNPIWNAVRGAGYYANKKNRAQMIASGGSFNFGHLYGNRSDELKAQLKRNLRDSSVISDPASALKAAKWSWRRWNDATEFAENINRAKVYQANLDRGKLYAAFQSRDLMDFASHGSWFMTRFLIDTVPFLNARLQGLDKLYRDGFKPTLLTAFGQGGASDRVRAKRFSIVTGALMVASIGLYLHNQDDEDYQALEEWQKDTYWFFKNGDDAYFVPKPFEVGAIATMAERMTQQFADPNAGGDLFKERLWHMLTQTFAFSPVPQMAAPVLDVYANRDPFRDRPIESYWDQVLSPSLRFRSSTTMQMRYLSKGLENTLGDESFLSLSPKQLDYLFNGYLGSVGSYAAGMIDTMLRRAKGIESPSSRWTESKPIRRFYRDLATPAYYTRYQTLFYEGLREADRVYADVKKLEKMDAIEEAREKVKNKGDLLRLRKHLNDARSDLSDISKRMDQIKTSADMDADYKRRELERLRTVRNRITEVLGKEVEKLNAN